MKTLLTALLGMSIAIPCALGHGMITVRSRSPAFIYLDGHYVGPAPRIIVQVSDGEHRVTVVSMETRERFVRDVIVAGMGAVVPVVARFRVTPERHGLRYFRPPEHLAPAPSKEKETPVKEPVTVPTPEPVKPAQSPPV